MNNDRKTVDTHTFAEILALPDDVKQELGLAHTPAEISQQPETWKSTFGTVSENAEKIREFLLDCGLARPDNGGVCVTLIGAGTSDYVGRAVAPLLRKMWRCHVRVVPSTDLMTAMDAEIGASPSDTRHLWISFSRSGDSFEGVRVLEKALEKYPQIRHLIVTCSEKGKMANVIARGTTGVFCITLDRRTNDQGLAMTSSFTNMVVAGQCLAHIFDLESYRPVIDSLTAAGEANMTAISEFARGLAAVDISRICFLGSGALKAVSDESALKVLEMSGGHYSVMSESFLGLRHGPLSWLGESSMVVGFISSDPDIRQVELGLLREVYDKQAAKAIAAILPSDVGVSEEFIDHRLVVNCSDDLDDIYRPPFEIMFGQFFGLFASLKQGLKPDAPSADGKIQRVVSDITFA